MMTIFRWIQKSQGFVLHLPLFPNILCDHAVLLQSETILWLKWLPRSIFLFFKHIFFSSLGRHTAEV